MKRYRQLGMRVPEELYLRLQNNLEWGERNRIYIAVLTWVCDMIEKHGNNALIVFLRKPKDLASLITKEEE